MKEARVQNIYIFYFIFISFKKKRFHWGFMLPRSQFPKSLPPPQYLTLNAIRRQAAQRLFSPQPFFTRAPFFPSTFLHQSFNFCCYQI